MRIQFEWKMAGKCFHPEFITIRSGSFKSCEFPSYFGIFNHPKRGLILYDTGYSERFSREVSHFPGKLYGWMTPVKYSPSETALAQIQAKGLSAQDVKYIFISHFHADHISGLKDFPNAQLVCFKSAFDEISELGPWKSLLHGVLPDLLPEGIKERALWVEDTMMISLPAYMQPFHYGFDLFGDQSLIAVELPGHTQGQMGLLFQDLLGQEVFLIGDACWSSRAYQENRTPNPITRLILSNWREYCETLSRLNHLHRSYPKLKMIPSHCSFAASGYPSV